METKDLQTKVFQTVFESAPNAIIVSDPKGKIVLVNKQVENYFGYDREELYNKSIEILIPQRFRKNHKHFRTEFGQKPISRAMGVGRDLYGLRKDGTEFPVEIGLQPINTDEGIMVLAVIVDIVERKALEEEHRKLELKIQQTQKLESLGVLAGGIAHDFNNLLTGILGNADLAKMELSPVSTVHNYIDKVQAAAIRAADLSKQMLAYSGRGSFAIQPLNLNEVIEEMLQLLEVSISKSAAFNYHLSPDISSIEGDITQIRQIVMNLITNASEAIVKSKGIITIKTGVTECDMQYLSEIFLAENLPTGIYVFLEIGDNGKGMDWETQQKIFDPFFTTKMLGRGLGLAAVQGIVRSHKGAIRVYSEPGRGTTFKILFPSTDLKPKIVKENGANLSILKEIKKVLVIDDEESVRYVAKMALQTNGVEVITAIDGQHGVDQFRKNRNQVSLVVLDLTMPNLNGVEVFRQIRHLDSEIPVIITSGYSEQEIANEFNGGGFRGFIQKPLRPKVLLLEISRVLKERES